MRLPEAQTGVEPPAKASRTGRWGLRRLESRSWPDRSALTTTMGKFLLQTTGPAITRFGGFGLAGLSRLGSLPLTLTRIGRFHSIRGRCGDDRRFEGDGRRGCRRETLDSICERHRTPPRAAREKPGKIEPRPFAVLGPRHSSRDRPFLRPVARRARTRSGAEIYCGWPALSAGNLPIGSTNPRFLQFQV